MSGAYKWEEVNYNNSQGQESQQQQNTSKENTSSSSRIDHLLEQRRQSSTTQQTNTSNSNGQLYQSDTIDLPMTSYASSKKLLQSSAFSLFNQLAVMELEQNVWGTSNRQSEEETMTFTPISTNTNQQHIDDSMQHNESGVDTDDDVEQYTNFIDSYESSFIPDDEDGSNVFEYEVDKRPSSYHGASSYDGISGDFTNTPSFNSKGRFTDYTDRHEVEHEEEVTNRVHLYDSTSGSGGYTNRKKRKYCIITSVVLTTLAIAGVLVTMFLVVISKTNDKEYYQLTDSIMKLRKKMELYYQIR